MGGVLYEFRESIKIYSDEEIKDYFLDKFGEYEWEISDEIIDILIDLTDGYSELMRICGNAIYWEFNNTVSIIDSFEETGYHVYGYVCNVCVDSKERTLKAISRDLNDYTVAIKLNSDEINEVCFSILDKLLDEYKNNIDVIFRKPEFISKLDNGEKEIFDEYLDKLDELGFIFLHNDAFKIMDAEFLFGCRLQVKLENY